MLNNCFSPRVKLSPSVTLMWGLQVEVYPHLVIRENGRCGLLIWHMISIMFTFAWTIGWHLSAGIVAMGGMDNSSSRNHGYHRQVSSSCFTWSVLCPSMAKMFSWWHFPVEKPFPVAAGLMKLHLPSSPSHSPLPPFPLTFPFYFLLLSLRPPPPLLSSSLLSSSPPPPSPSLFPSLLPFFSLLPFLLSHPP